MNHLEIILIFLFMVFGCLDPKVSTLYKMEVLRDPESKVRPLFRVTPDTGEQVSSYMIKLYCSC